LPKRPFGCFAREGAAFEVARAANLSKNTDYLVAGSKSGSVKMRAAEKHGTPILDENAFPRLLGKR